MLKHGRTYYNTVERSKFLGLFKRSPFYWHYQYNYNGKMWEVVRITENGAYVNDSYRVYFSKGDMLKDFPTFNFKQFNKD